MYIDPKFHDRMQPSLVSHGCYGDLHERFRRQGTKNYTAHITAGYAVGEFMENLGGIVSTILNCFIERQRRKLIVVVFILYEACFFIN